MIYAIHLFAACIQLLYGKQGDVLVVASLEFLPLASMEGKVPLQQILHSKKHLVAPLLGWHVKTTQTNGLTRMSLVLFILL